MLPVALRYLGYAAALALAYYWTYREALTGEFANRFATEAPQEALLLLMALATGYVALRGTRGRVLAAALAGFYLASLVREYNNPISDAFGQGAWLYPALAVAAATLLYVVPRWRRLDADVRAVAGTFAFGVLSSGVVVLHVFTRLFGANPLWRATMGADYQRVVARTAEEGTELMAYTLMALGTAELVGGWLRGPDRAAGIPS